MIGFMKPILRFIFYTAFMFIVVLSCKEDMIIIETEPDVDSAVRWHYGDVDLLDSVAEYLNGICTLRIAWSYDEFGRPIDRNEYRCGSNEEYYRSQWSYSDGGKTITLIMSKQEGKLWNDFSKDVITVIADRDSCIERYKKVDNKWVKDHLIELAYDNNGRLILEYGYYLNNNYGTKREYAYDNNGHCILKKEYSGKNGEWILSRQSEYAFDDRGNCLCCKAQKYNSSSGKMVGDSLVERSFDNKDRLTGYSLMKWDFGKSNWMGKQKYTLSYDEYGNVIENIIYKWNDIVDKWVFKSKSSKLFDSEGRLLSNADYYWEDNAWHGWYFKTERIYDNSGYLSAEMTYSWDDTNACWVLDKTEQYNSEGNMNHSVSTSSISANGNVYLNRLEMVWEDSFFIREETSYTNDEITTGQRQIYYNDEMGRDTFVVVFNWWNDKWIEVEKVYHTYDVNGIQLKFLRYRLQPAYNSYDDGEWILENGSRMEMERIGNTEIRQELLWNYYNKCWDESSVKYYLTYDESDRILESISQHKIWDDEVNTHWENMDKTDYTYDRFGNKTGFVDYNWNYEENEWIPREKKEYEFDESGRKIHDAGYMYDASKGIWIGTLKSATEYDKCGYVILLINYSWGESDWQPSLKTEYSYNYNGVKSDVKLYDWAYRDGNWEWLGRSRTIYSIDPETNTNVEYNLSFDYASKTWVGNRLEKKTDENGNVISSIYYSWKNECWMISNQYDWTFDSNGNVTRYTASKEGAEGLELMLQIDYTYDSMNRLVLQVEKNGQGVIIYEKSVCYTNYKNIKIIDGMEF